jgi:hypothetical protein
MTQFYRESIYNPAIPIDAVALKIITVEFGLLPDFQRDFYYPAT